MFGPFWSCLCSANDVDVRAREEGDGGDDGGGDGDGDGGGRGGADDDGGNGGGGNDDGDGHIDRLGKRGSMLGETDMVKQKCRDEQHWG